MKADDKYSAMGIASLIPGMQFMIDLMQGEVNKMRSALTQLQNGTAPRPTKKTGWSDDPEERRKEAKRRMMMRKRKAGAVKRWAGMSAAKKKEMIAKMHAARWAKKGTK